MKPRHVVNRWSLVILPVVIAILLGIYPLPKAGQVLLNEAGQASLIGDHSTAARAYARAAQLLPSHPQIWEQAGDAAWDAGDYQAGAGYYQAARNAGALSENRLLNLAAAYIQTGAYPAAEEISLQITDAGGDAAGIQMVLLEAYQTSGELEKASTFLPGMAAYQSGQPDLVYRQGLLLAVTAPEQVHPVFLRLAEIDSAYLGKTTRIEAGIAAAMLQEEPAYRLTIISQALGAVGEWHLASEGLQRAVAMRPDYAEAWALLGEASQQLGGDGEIELTRALSLDPDSLLSLSLSALHNQRQQEWQQAVDALQKVAALDPENPQWQIDLGFALAGLGDLDAAYKSYTLALKLNPDSHAAWREMAAFCLAHNYQAEDVGFPAARRAVQLAPQDPASLDVLAQAYMARGDLLTAGKFLQRAAASGPEYALTFLHLGMVQRGLGDPEAARLSFQHAVELDPAAQAGIQALRLLEELDLAGGTP